MNCPSCGGHLQCRDSREAEGGRRRRYVCARCKQRHTSFEMLVGNEPEIGVTTKDKAMRILAKELRNRAVTAVWDALT